jgi:hypothetical protein
MIIYVVCKVFSELCYTLYAETVIICSHKMLILRLCIFS